MNFGLALEELKKGNKVSRAGWNGKGMWLIFQPASPWVALNPESVYGRNVDTKLVNIDAHVDMYTAGGTIQPGWVCSQADMLAEDWGVV